VAGAGNAARSRYCDTRRRKGETTGNTNIDLNKRASPRPYLHGIDANSRALGDVIVGANDQTVRRLSDLTDELEQVGVGNSIKLTLLRGSQKVNVDVPVTDIGPTP
jgi:S1-C subfamily serine protease